MKSNTPGPVSAGSEGEIEKAGPLNLVLPNKKNNQPSAARRKRFQHLGQELHRRGEYPNAQFCAWLAEQPNADEILRCLEDFCRIAIGDYLAVDADRFPSYLIPLDGGRR